MGAGSESREVKPGSWEWKPGSREWKPGSWEWKPGSREWKPGSREWKPGSREWKPGSRECSTFQYCFVVTCLVELLCETDSNPPNAGGVRCCGDAGGLPSEVFGVLAVT